MAVIVGIVIACALFVTLAGGVFTDIKIFGLLREQWRLGPRRRLVTIAVAETLGVIGGTTLIITAPFGPYTFAYLIGGIGVAVFLGLNLYAVSQVRHNRRGN